MPYVVMSDAYPGAWGYGVTEKEATAEWRRNGGSGVRLLHRIHDGYAVAWVDEMGRLWADAGPLLDGLPRRERPDVVVEVTRIGTPGRPRIQLDPATYEEVAA